MRKVFFAGLLLVGAGCQGLGYRASLPAKSANTAFAPSSDCETPFAPNVSSAPSAPKPTALGQPKPATTPPVQQRPPAVTLTPPLPDVKTPVQQEAAAAMPTISQQVMLVPKVVYIPYMETIPAGPVLVKNLTSLHGQQTTTTTTEASPDQVKQLNDVIANLKQKLERIERYVVPPFVAPPPVETVPSFPIAPAPEIPQAPLPNAPRHPSLIREQWRPPGRSIFCPRRGA